MPGSAVTIEPAGSGVSPARAGGRGFVDLESHTVTEPVAECIPVARVRNDLARRAVHFSSGHARLAGRDACELSVQHRIVHGLHLISHMADRNRTRHVRAVAVHNAAKVHGDKIARLNFFPVGTPCGLELFAPDTTIGSNDMFSAP